MNNNKYKHCVCICISDMAGAILKPTVAGSNLPSGQPEKLVSDDLDSSLANLVGSECDALVSLINFHYGTNIEILHATQKINAYIFFLRPRDREWHNEKVSDNWA